MTGLTGYDSVYYLGIASEGYHLAPITQSYRDWAFFPAYPLLVRAADLVLPGVDRRLPGCWWPTPPCCSACCSSPG